MLRHVSICALAVSLAAAAPPVVNRPVDFNRDIRPILSDNCFACHGPDEKQRMVKLRLDTREGAFADRGGYQVIVPGNSAGSRLYQRISAEKPALRMPPPNADRSLTEPQVAMIRRWIDEGARWEQHWAYTAPVRAELPYVKNTGWPRNPIDRFILARLEQEGLKPSPEADRITLLRRVSFDLTGLPPTPAEVTAFLADRSPDAYEKQVDRLLQSPHYGERMAMHWLDLARYADTHGYHIDSHRDMWPWRDWVIRAYNQNLPFDQFTIDQLAGDLLPDATTDQKIATGFHRNHMINFEGGAIPEEYQNEYVVDRVETTSTVWLGSTLACTRCHDHKYDPFRQKEFYQLGAFFNTIPEKGLDGRAGNAEPFLPLPNAEQKVELDELRSKMDAQEKAVADAVVARLIEPWEKGRLEALPPEPRNGILLHYEFDGSLSDISGHYQHGRLVKGELGYASGAVGRSADFGERTHVVLGGAELLDEGPFALTVWLRPSGKEQSTVLEKLDAGGRGFVLDFDEPVALGDLKKGSHLSVRLASSADSAIEIRTKERFVYGDFQHIALVYDGSGKAAGLRLYIDGTLEPCEAVRDSLKGSFGNSTPLEIGNTAVAAAYRGRIDDLRIYGRLLDANEINLLAVEQPVRTILREGGRRSKDQKERLTAYFLKSGAPEPIRSLYAEWMTLKPRQEALDKAIPTVMVMSEMDKPRPTYVLGRGDYRNRGERVQPDVPATFPPLPPDAPRNRLGLARWLMDPAHPLTARVAVNRYWQMYFGIGLVKTTEDFGSQGDMPSHPQLLDWLATEFIRTGWDVRAMQRLIVTSAAYRQASKVTPALLERDPEDRLLARGPRFRLPAEMVRDNALAVSGLLDERIGGRSVFPYQPPGLWEELAFGDVYSAQKFSQSHGKDLYRRSMYTFWKRTSPPPTMTTFDAPDREKCVARRPITNTPLQALALLNDPTYVEAARALAQRTLLEGGHDPARGIAYVFEQATARKPASKEAHVLQELLRGKLADYRRDSASAEKLLAIGESPYDRSLDAAELAAWTTVASVLLNLDETVTKE